jgi:hypothetical protein
MRVSFDWRNILLWGVAFGTGTTMICLGPVTIFTERPVKVIRRGERE